jgi:hypothetical protein
MEKTYKLLQAKIQLCSTENFCQTCQQLLKNTFVTLWSNSCQTFVKNLRQHLGQTIINKSCQKCQTITYETVG